MRVFWQNTKNVLCEVSYLPAKVLRFFFFFYEQMDF